MAPVQAPGRGVQRSGMIAAAFTQRLDLHDSAFRCPRVGGQMLDQVHRGGSPRQHQAGHFPIDDAGRVPATRPHADALALRHAKSRQRRQVRAAVGGAFGDHLDDLAGQRHDGLLRQ
ncbi:hypothetical protein G6F31_018145 [Rhizopus arrhizus]|nr:hypothetical protein G6F31_018145 [Rhizopus arrhizus]